ncbi:Auxin responsive protein [Zea mays]|jgi:SAUR family protein|uniref:Auxin responsive protein n=1 Tax=Zea mays TaxID=4577 RepID=A0A1D6I664_MAIZE|nr:Auxin responsive protein [Zea mays]|eukprot:XP_008653984.1 auxin-responsive protein SAUR71 [Zea mays]
MAAWTRKATAKAMASCVTTGAVRDDDGNKQRIPKGYIPLVLVRDGEGEGGSETRILVRVRDLREPCMAVLLEMAEEQFGYGQQGVLKVPCDAQRFHHVVAMARKSKVASA